ncbi:MAG: hypothetical protein H7A40_00005 [Chlamydiales bacterium]|nr:hypothetical protein [Chlamydiales bacterium]
MARLVAKRLQTGRKAWTTPVNFPKAIDKQVYFRSTDGLDLARISIGTDFGSLEEQLSADDIERTRHRNDINSISNVGSLRKLPEKIFLAVFKFTTFERDQSTALIRSLATKRSSSDGSEKISGCQPCLIRELAEV